MQLFKNLKFWSALRRASAKPLEADSLDRCDRAIPIGRSKDWYFPLPDRVWASNSPILGNFKHNTLEVLVYGSYQSAPKKVSPQSTPAIICVDKQHFFLQALLPLRYTGEKIDRAVSCWLKVDPLVALSWLKDSEADIKPSRFRAILANAFIGDQQPYALHAVVTAQMHPGNNMPIISDLDETACPFPGLAPALDDDGQLLISHLEREGVQNTNKPLSLLREALFEDPPDTINDVENFFCAEENKHWRYNAQALYLTGTILETLEGHTAAAWCFHEAQLMCHPFALDREWAARGSAARHFRSQYPEVFDLIEHGDRLRALTTLRLAAPKFPLEGNAILAYCLRTAGYPEEGLAACAQSLKLEHNQSDVLGHQWAFLTELQRDAEALETAIEHIMRYPEDSVANINLIDSLVLSNELESAIELAHRYFILSGNFELSLKQFFKVYEPTNQWGDLGRLFDAVMPLLSAPSVETLSFYGEVLIELQRFSEGFELFERALTIEPGSGRVVLGYARALARADKEDQAESLLQTVLLDDNRIDSDEERAFIVTMLAEIRRRTGRPQLALSTFEDEFAIDPIALSQQVGPMPAIEYAETLLALGKRSSATRVISQLKSLWPQDPFVDELTTLI